MAMVKELSINENLILMSYDKEPYSKHGILQWKEITRLNAEWRGVDRATDVLSFECERPSDPDLAEGEPCELGDIVLAPGFLRRQAARMGTTEADEARLMLVHGTLHLLGFDHMEPDEARDMQGREDDVLSSIPTDGTLTDVVLADHRSEEEA